MRLGPTTTESLYTRPAHLRMTRRALPCASAVGLPDRARQDCASMAARSELRPCLAVDGALTRVLFCAPWIRTGRRHPRRPPLGVEAARRLAVPSSHRTQRVRRFQVAHQVCRSFLMNPSWSALADSSPNRNDRPFIIDLDSANGTMVNDEAIPASRFYELRSGDGARFFPYLAALETVV